MLRSSAPAHVRLRLPMGMPHWPVLLLYTLLTGIMTWPLAANLTTTIPGDSFDGWQNYWNLWWMKVALIERMTSPFTTDLLYHPTGVELYFHTLNPFNGLITLPIQLSGGLILAYNTVVWISWVLGGYGAFLLALWILQRRAGVRYGVLGSNTPVFHTQFIPYASAFLAGTIFTFAPFHMAHLLGHMQVMSLEWMPFYILYLLRSTCRLRSNRPWLRDGLLAGFFLVLVGLCDWYYVLYLVLFTGLYLIADIGYGVLRLSPRKSQISIQSLLAPTFPAVTAGLVFFVLLSPILIPMIGEAIRFDFMERPASDLYILSATLADFLIPNRLHTVFRPESFGWPGNQIAPVSERTIAIGYLPLLLALLGGLLDRRRSGFWLLTAAAFLLIALGPAFNLFHMDWADVPTGERALTWMPYDLLNRTIPFMRISRSVSRFAVMVQLGVAVAAAIGLAALTRRLSGSIASGVVVVAILIVLGEYWVAPYPLSPPDTPTYYTQLRDQPGNGAVLNLPMNYDRPGYLLYQTVHRKPLTVAYISRDDPRTYTTRTPVLQHFRHLAPDILDVDPAAVGQTVLHDLGVAWVILDRYKMPGGEERIYTTELAQAIFTDMPPVYEDERLTIYQVAPPLHPQPYVLLGPAGWGVLQMDKTGEHSRVIEQEPAALLLRHTPSHASLEIRYRTQNDAAVQILLPELGNRVLATLPPAPQRTTVTLALADLIEPVQGSMPAAIVDEIALAAGGDSSAWIESIRIVDHEP